MSELPQQRVRVTGPTRRRTAPVRPGAAEVGAGTRIGEVYLDSLLLVQLALALRILALLAVGVGSWPLLFHLAPGLARVGVLGLPLSWLLLGVLVYPFLVLLGLRYVRRAEENEERFADLLGHAERDGRDGRNGDPGEDGP
ncbi:MAG: hypothetical protein QM572_12840 [Nocardioides sp.]|uniref:hypothetical protein n=1 Tax=Nocardioides sp. TaxID=35761 RepID=UPI0039E529A4